MMSLPNDQRTVQDSDGNEIPFADIEVRDLAGGLVTIYSDADGTTEITQPGFQSDANGFYRFYAQPGYYEITVTGPEGARVLARVNLERGVTSLSDITSIADLNTAALVDGQQFSVKDGDNARYFQWDDTAGEFVEMRLVTLADSFLYGPDQPEDQGGINKGPSIRRLSTTTENLEIFVDVDASAGGDGSQGSPLNNINAALELVPREMYHKVRIYLADGVYAGDDNTWNLYNYFVSPRSTAGFQIIGHVPENPLYTDTDLTAVTLGDASAGTPTATNFVIGGVLGDSDDTKIAGLTVDARVQVYGSNFAFDRVNFKTGDNGILLGGHSGRVKCTECDFSDAADAINAIDLAWFFFERCTGSSITGRVAFVRNGSFVSFEDSSSLVSQNIIEQEGNCIAKVDGQYVSAGTGGQATWGVRSGGTGDTLLSTDNDGNMIAKGAFVGGKRVVGEFGAGDKFALYQDNDGNLQLRIRFAGTERVVKLYDFATDTVS